MHQCGFKPGRATADQLNIMRQMTEKCWEQNIDIHNLFLDFESAYDTVVTDEIWTPMHNLGIPKNW